MDRASGSGVGSSPRMRGAQPRDGSQRRARGIIPAYAGSTCRLLLVLWRSRDHPRVCGEHLMSHPPAPLMPGSSPRMRGAQFFISQGGKNRGIIPAYAGSTEIANPGNANYRDHPRVCGEHRRAAFRILAAQGSSPRMRGAHHDSSYYKKSDGIIPAYAGSTAARWWSG